MLYQIKGKVVVITGASSGIGEATALTLAANGAKVVLGARRTAQLKTLTDTINNKGGEAVFLETDVKCKDDLQRLVDFAVNEYGKLDVMVNNAGVCHLGRIDELDVTGWEEMIDINLKGVLYGMAAAIPVFTKQQSGHIVNIISTAGIKIVPTQGVYAATKNAVRTVAEAFRQESDGAVRITGISPGFVKTGFIGNIRDETLKAAMQRDMEQRAIPPEAVANAVMYAISQPQEVEIGDIIIRPSAQK
ncbi:SDR family oxidoreductase [Chitinophaga varians]|uniref:SDR family oxidoreductase n=1 Tax=Chitinophaga varians TaxID=2202339 RepID=UPI00165EF5AC|nr:SDR family oxidoreductase [Chitinophaga varians]MBC9912323.1 SDR family oxidoreductase [Chitinophaga varians]